jgi:peptide/nickel transport system substrate-binding protein
VRFPEKDTMPRPLRPVPGLPQPGGTLRFAVCGDQGCGDPQQAGSNDTIHSLRQIVDSLTGQDPASGELRPWLATDRESNVDADEPVGVAR